MRGWQSWRWSSPALVLVRISDSAWLGVPPAAAQNQQHEATKAQLAEAQAAASRLERELAGLQAEHQAACSAKADLVKERGQLEKRVRLGRSRAGQGRCRCQTRQSRPHTPGPSNAEHPGYRKSQWLCWDLSPMPVVQLEIEAKIRSQLKEEVLAKEAAQKELQDQVGVAALGAVINGPLLRRCAKVTWLSCSPLAC